MTQLELMQARHSVRNFLNKPIPEDIINLLNSEIDACNKEGGLRFWLVTEEPEAFRANKPHYGQFSGCRNYFVLVGPVGADETVGYYGERLVLKAQELGLNTCWVAITYRKGTVKLDLKSGEKLHLVIALGYGVDQGVAVHSSKPVSALSNCTESSPQWFKDGMEAVLLAPTAIHQQKFYIENRDGVVYARAKLGLYSKTDLGIVKYHFELGAGKENFTWGTE